MCSDTVLQTGVIVTFLVWKPELGDIMIFFNIAGVRGIVDSVWLVQISGKKTQSNNKKHNYLYGSSLPIVKFS